MNSLSISLADTVFSIGVEIIFLVQGKICTYIIPLDFVGQVCFGKINFTLASLQTKIAPLIVLLSIHLNATNGEELL